MDSRLYLEIDTKRSEAIARVRYGKKPELGRQLAQEARALFATMPADEPRRGELAAGMAELMLELGQAGDAEALIKQSLDIDGSSLAGNLLGTRYMFLAQLLVKQQRWDEAEEYVLKAIDAPYGELGFAHSLLREIREAKQ